MLIAVIILSISTFILLTLTILLCFAFYGNIDTLSRWTSHKDLLWVTDIKRIKVIYCIGNGFITLFEDSFNIFTTCCDNAKRKEYNHIWNAPIKYIKGYDEETHTLIVQLWNTKKLNKKYGIKENKQ